MTSSSKFCFLNLIVLVNVYVFGSTIKHRCLNFHSLYIRFDDQAWIIPTVLLHSIFENLVIIIQVIFSKTVDAIFHVHNVYLQRS